VKNVAYCQIDFLSEDMKKMPIKDSLVQEEKQREEPSGEVQEVKEEDNQHNHFRRIEDMLQVIPNISSSVLYERK